MSVLLIRENAEQLTGAGCCGGVSDDDPSVQRRNLFGESRGHQEDLGVLHRAIRTFFPAEEGCEQVRVEIVDPRNQLYLWPKLLYDVFQYRPGWRAGLQSVFQAFSLPAVVVNGRVVSRRGEPLTPDALCCEISLLLGQPSGGGPDACGKL